MIVGIVGKLFNKPWIWSFLGAGGIYLATIAVVGGLGAGGMATAALSLAVFTVVVGVGQMFVITLGPGNVDLSLPANLGLASAIAMKVMGGDDAMIPLGIAAALGGERHHRGCKLPAHRSPAHTADHRDALGELHHPVHRHQLRPRSADQTAAGLRRFHQSPIRRRAGPGAWRGRHDRRASPSFFIERFMAARSPR